jgi:cytochrome c-type biogenesis protein CcmH/NrfG
MRKAALEVMTQPDSARVHLRMGRLCLERGLVGRAILSLERAKRLDPRLADVDALLAQARSSVREASSVSVVTDR